MKDDFFLAASFAVLLATRTEAVHILFEKDEGSDIRLEIHGSHNRLHLAAVEIMVKVIQETMRGMDLNLQLSAAHVLMLMVKDVLNKKVLTDEVIEERRVFHAETDHDDGSAGADHEG